MKFKDSNIHDFLYTPGASYVVPIFQRPYSWTVDNAKDFLADLEAVHENPEKEHYFGSVVTGSERFDADIIDGQQRVTTTLLMLTAIYHIGLKFPDKLSLDHYKTDDINEKFLFNPNARDGIEQNRIKLRTVTVDDEIFEKIYRLYTKENNTLQTADDLTAVEKSSRLYLVYRYFYDYFKNKPELSAYVKALERFLIVQILIDTTNGDDAQRIFESINSTGEPLSNGDKIRNFALMLSDQRMREKVYNDYWVKIERALVRVNSDEELSEFFRFYLMSIKQVEIKQREVYPKFRDYFKECIPDDTDENMVASMFGEMKNYLDYYLLLKYHKTALTKINSDDFRSKCDLDLMLSAFRLAYLKIETPFPFLMRALNEYNNNRITREDILNIFDIVESYLVRRLIAGNGTTSINKVFQSLHKNIVNAVAKFDGVSYVDAMSRILLDYDGDMEFPDDKKIADAIATKDFYNIRGQYKLFILYSINDQGKESKYLEQSLNDQGEKALNFSIEHVMPQTLSDRWKEKLGENWYDIHEKYLHTLANLTLTGYNSEYSNLLFVDDKCPEGGKDKKTLIDKNGDEVGLAYSPLPINAYFRTISKWDEEEINNRAKWLTQRVKQTWKLPTTSFVFPDNTIKKTIDEDFDYRDRTLKEYSILGETYSASGKSWYYIYAHIMHLIFEAYPELYQKFTENEVLRKSYILSEKRHKSDRPLDLFGDDINEDDAHYFLNSNSSTNEKVKIIRQVLDLLSEEDADALNISFAIEQK